MRLFPQVALLVLAVCGQARGAFTEPRLALLSGQVDRSSSGAITLHLQGSFSIPDAVQLDLPLEIVVQQGALRARMDLAGNVSTSIDGGAERPVPGPGVVGVAARELVVVLPPGFTTGTLTVQVLLTYEGHSIGSNRLGVPL